MKPPGPFLSVVPEPGDEDPEIERYLGAARELAGPSEQNRARVARGLNAALPATTPLPAFGTAGLPVAARGTSLLRATGPWLALGAAVIGGLGFGLGVLVARPEPTPGAAPGSMLAVPAGTSPGSAARDTSAPPPATAGAPPATAVVPPASAGAPPATGTSDELAPPNVPPSASGSPAPETASADAPRPAEDRRHPASPRAPGASAPLRRAAPSHGAATLATPASSLGFREALDQLRRAREQLEQGHATMSLLLLSELDRQAGELLFEEREATRVLALCATDQQDAARAAARRLAQLSPRSIYARRLASSCIAADLEVSGGATLPAASDTR